MNPLSSSFQHPFLSNQSTDMPLMTPETIDDDIDSDNSFEPFDMATNSNYADDEEIVRYEYIDVAQNPHYEEPEPTVSPFTVKTVDPKPKVTLIEVNGIDNFTSVFDHLGKSLKVKPTATQQIDKIDIYNVEKMLNMWASGFLFSEIEGNDKFHSLFPCITKSKSYSVIQTFGDEFLIELTEKISYRMFTINKNKKNTYEISEKHCDTRSKNSETFFITLNSSVFGKLIKELGLNEENMKLSRTMLNSCSDKDDDEYSI